MTLKLGTGVPEQLSWLRHPWRRAWVNHYARRVARNISGSTINVETLCGNHALQRAADYLMKRGIGQITKEGTGSSCLLVEATLPAITDLPNAPRATVFLNATHQRFIAGERRFARIVSPEQAQTVPISRLLSGAQAVRVYNLLAASEFCKGYFGPGVIADALHPLGRMWGNEGELSVLQAAFPPSLPMHTEDTFATRRANCPAVILKDESRPRTVLAAASGGLIGAINFGPKRLYELVEGNARYLYKSLSEGARADYTVFLGKCDRFIRFFGVPMVGNKTLAEYTDDTITKKPGQFMLIVKPLSPEADPTEARPMALVARGTVAPWQFNGLTVGHRQVWAELIRQKLITPNGDVVFANLNSVTKETLVLPGLTSQECGIVFDILEKAQKQAGQIKYVYPSAKLVAQLAKVAKSFGVKLAQGIKGADLRDFLARIPESALTEEEKDQLTAMTKAASQPDVESTTWDLMEVVPGAFVAHKGWLENLSQELEKLDKRFRDETGNSMLRILRQRGGLYRLEDLVYLAMVTSEQGMSEAGFVGKFPGLQGVIDPGFLQAVYQVIRDKVFQGGKMFALNIGGASKVIEFNGEDGVKNFVGIIGHTITYDHRFFSSAAAKVRADWRYWRTLLDIPHDPVVIENSYIGSRRGIGNRLHHWWRRDLIIRYSSVGSNLPIGGPCYLYGCSVDALEPLQGILTRGYIGPLIGINSTGSFSWSGAKQADGVFMYNFRPLAQGIVTGSIIDRSGFYFAIETDRPLEGSGEQVVSVVEILNYPGPKAEKTNDPELVKKTLDGLNPQTTTGAEVRWLNKILGTITRHQSQGRRS